MKKHLEGAFWAVAFGGPLLATQTSTRAWLALIAIVSIASFVVVIPLHFWRAWAMISVVPNRREYAVWVGLETLFTVASVSGCVYMVSAR
jgi:hypothetical protein